MSEVTSRGQIQDQPRDPTDIAAARDKIIEEHRQLRAGIAELRDFLGEPRPDVGDPEAHPWAQQLAHHLLDLHGKLYCHFRSEEEGGFFDDLRTTAPHAGGSVDALEHEHTTMLDELRQVLTSALCYASADPPADLALRRQTLAILQELEQHEAQETHLMEEVYWHDLGRGAA